MDSRAQGYYRIILQDEARIRDFGINEEWSDKIFGENQILQ